MFQIQLVDTRGRTRVVLPVKVLAWIAVTSEGQSSLLARGAVSKGNMPVGDVVEEVNLALVQHETSRNGMDRSITPSLVEETAITVKRVEEVSVGFAAKPVQVANLKVGPEMAVVVILAAVVAQEAHGVVCSNVLGVVLHELLGAVPESLDGLGVLIQAKNKAVLLATLVHDAERIVVDIAIQLNGGLNTPVVFVVHHERLSEEETRFEAAHVTVTDGVTVDDFTLSHVLAHLLGLVLVNPLGERPMLGGNLAIVCLTRDQV